MPRKPIKPISPDGRSAGLEFLLAMIARDDEVTEEESEAGKNAVLEGLARLGTACGNLEMFMVARHLRDCVCRPQLRSMYYLLRDHEEQTNRVVDDNLRAN